MREVEIRKRAVRRDRRAMTNVAQRIGGRERDVGGERDRAVVGLHVAGAVHRASARVPCGRHGADVEAVIARVVDAHITARVDAGRRERGIGDHVAVPAERFGCIEVVVEIGEVDARCVYREALRAGRKIEIARSGGGNS